MVWTGLNYLCEVVVVTYVKPLCEALCLHAALRLRTCRRNQGLSKHWLSTLQDKLDLVKPDRIQVLMSRSSISDSNVAAPPAGGE